MAVTTLGRRLIDSFTSFKEATCTHYNEARKSRKRRLKHQQQKQQQIFPHNDNDRQDQQKLLWIFSFCNQRNTNSIKTRKKINSRVYNSQRQYNNQSSKVFGCELIDHVNFYNTNDDCVPQIVRCCANYIEKQGILFGIYRLSGTRSNIHQLRQDFDENPLQKAIDSEIISNDAHAVACVMKQYFRELPTPLLTFQLYEKFINLFMAEQTLEATPSQQCATNEPQLLSMSSIVENSTIKCISSSFMNSTNPTNIKSDNDEDSETEEQIEQNRKHQVILEDLKLLLMQLPKVHFKTLKFLIRHLACIAANGEKTGMDSKNVAIVWAPNLLKPRELELTGGIETFQMISVQAILTEQLIKHYEFLLGSDDEGDVSQSITTAYNSQYTTDGLTTSNSSSINDFHSAADLIMYD